MKLPGIYAIVVGALMVIQWCFFLVTGQVPELQSEPWRIALHLAAELITAAGLVVAGVGILRQASWAPCAYLVFAGMLVYSVVASPGYFAQQGQWILVAMFAVLLILAVISVIDVSKKIVA
jgi:hypothetical protein